MANIKFNNDKKIYCVKLSNYTVNKSINRIKIVFNSVDEANSAPMKNGFVELNEHNFVEQADFSNMIYIYRKYDDGITFILTENVNDIYVEPDPQPTPQPYVPTLEEVKQNKILDFSIICNCSIISGVSLEINGEVEHFSYTDEDQRNIKEIFDLAIQTKIPMYYHANGKSCKLYSVEQIINLYSTASMNKMHHQTYFNQMKMYIMSLEDKETVEMLEYGITELTGEYLEIYNAAMEQARNSVIVLLTQTGTLEV